MHKALCPGIVFTITGNRGPSSLSNRYKLGRIVEGTLHLTPFEALFLFFKNRIRAENTFFNDRINIMRTLLPEPVDLVMYSVYEKLKLKGFYVKKEGKSLFFRRNAKEDYRGPLKVMRESSDITFNELGEFSGSLVATVDDENDITFFQVMSADPRGSADVKFPDGSGVRDVGDRYALDSADMPEWIGHDFNGVRFLTELEAGYARRGASVPGDDGNPLMRIYSDLVERRLIVKTGFKYGTNFRAYTTSMEEHADYLIHYLPGREEWYKVSRAVRVAHGVHKVVIFAGLDNDEIKYVAVERIRDPLNI